MPEYAYTIRALLPSEERAISHLANLVRYHDFPAVGELWEIKPDGTRKLIIAHEPHGFANHRRVERAVEALSRLDISTLGGEGTLRRIAQAVLDA